MPSNVLVPRPISSRIDQAARGRVVQDVRRLGHLDHERALAAGQFVARADAGEDAVGQPDRRPAAGTKLPICAISRQQRHLADVGDLPAMFGPVISRIVPSPFGRGLGSMAPPLPLGRGLG